MKEDILLFQEQCVKKGHIQSLIKNRHHVIGFKTAEESIFIKLENGMIAVHVPPPMDGNFILIEGKKEAIISLIRGERPLRKAVLLDLLAIKAPIRTTLMLEALFLLAKNHSDDKVII